MSSSRSASILPSDKNDYLVVSDINDDGTFSVQVPFVDPSRSLRRMSVTRLHTMQPFVPRNVSKLFDTTDPKRSSLDEDHFFVLSLDTKKLEDTIPRKNYDALKVDEKWKKYPEVMKVYEEGGNSGGILWNTDYFKEFWDTSLKKQYEWETNDFDFSKYVQVFAELGTKITEDEIGTSSSKDLSMDEMKIYFFPIDFYFPSVNQESTSSSTELDVGSTPTLSYDESLRSMLRFALIDINRGDIRSVLNESKRSLYLEYTVDSADATAKPVTKYVWIFTLGNPLFYGLSPAAAGETHYNTVGLSPDDLLEKSKLYGRSGTFVNIVNADKVGTKYGVYNSFLKGYLADWAYVLDPAVEYDIQKDNCLVCPLRCNFASVLLTALYQTLLSDGLTPVVTPSTYKAWESKREELKPFMVREFNLLGLYSGSIFGKDGIKDIENIRNLSTYTRANFFYSYYGNEFLLKLLCEQAETSLYNKNKKHRMQKLLALLSPNDVNYQQYLGSDNKIVIQPPNFRPLSLLQQAQTWILRDSNNELKFQIVDIDDEPVRFLPGDKIVMNLHFETTHTFKTKVV